MNNSPKKKIKEKHKKPKKRTLFQIISPIFSLILTILILLRLFYNIQIVIDHKTINSTILEILFLSLAVFIVPFIFNSKSLKKRFNKKGNRYSTNTYPNTELKIRKLLKLNLVYTPNLVNICPKCGFENPSNAKKCFNCLNTLNF